MIHCGDITKINGYEVPIVDAVFGGSPCQDLSVAGKRAGIQHSSLGDEETTRSGLFLEQIRLIKEMREHDRAIRGADDPNGLYTRPRYMCWENVIGAFSSPGGDRRGEDFAAVIEECIKVSQPEAPHVSVPQGGWTRSGCIYDELGRWSIAWTVHNASEWCVPQRRERISLICDFNGLSAAEILFERKGLLRHTESCEPKRKETSRDTGTGTEGTDESFTLKVRGGAEVDSKGKKAGKGALIRHEESATLSGSQDQTLFNSSETDGKL